MKRINRNLPEKTIVLALLIAILSLSGCAQMGSTETAATAGHEAASPQATIEFEPYYPADFRDLLIPGELLWNREKSVTISTDSFKGGILNFTGRVEVTSLMEFFANSMKNDGWNSIGSIRSRNVLLAYTKENSTCMIRINEGGAIGKTEISIYISNSSK